MRFAPRLYILVFPEVENRTHYIVIPIGHSQNRGSGLDLDYSAKPLEDHKSMTPHDTGS